jgi:hypothetical protein
LELLGKLLLFSLIISDLIFFFTDKPYNTNVANPSTRLLMGNIQYLISIIAISFYRYLPYGFSKRLYPRYCLAVEVAILAGLVHFICNKIGIPFMPILRLGDSNASDAVVAQIGGEFVQRVYGFCGEPKNLGFFIVPYCVASLILYLKGFYRVNKYFHLFSLVSGIFVLYSTFSSSALIEFFLAVPISILVARIKLKPSFVITLIVAVLGLFISSSLGTDENDKSLLNSIKERTIDRSSSELDEGRQETYLWDAYKEANIANQLFGWGAYQYTFHAPGQLYENGGFAALQSGLVLGFSDFGVLGIISLIFCLIFIFHLFRMSSSLSDHLPICYAVISLCVFVGNLMYGSISGILLYLIITVLSVYDSKTKIVLKKL